MPSSRELQLAPLARRDIEGILQYTLATYGVVQRDDYSDRLERATRRIADFPDSGRRRADLGRNLRSMPVGRHVVVYRVTPDAVVVVRILNSRQDIRRQFRR
jgi:toxin ParE1/3/4